MDNASPACAADVNLESVEFVDGHSLFTGKRILTKLQLLINGLFVILTIAVWGAFWIFWNYGVVFEGYRPHPGHTSAKFSTVDNIVAFIMAIEMCNALLGPALLFFAVRHKPLQCGTVRRCCGTVAMIVTKVPSEPLEMVRTTLEACLAQTGVEAYDVWLADEDPDADTLAFCASAGISVSCRKGVPGYHNPEWPRRRRCKEGNLAYFYDTHGYKRYDFVCQFDADHAPLPNYLATLLPWFDNPQVGYVACPSICDKNVDESWVVRGRLNFEAYGQGAMGSSRSMWAMPTCTGSHYAVRTAALREAGGIGPELDEDFSTSMAITSVGWKGAFSIDTIALGDGPVTFEDAMRQEFQWAQSAMLLLFKYARPVFARPSWTISERFMVFYFFFYWIFQSAFVLLTTILALGPPLGLQNFGFSWIYYVIFASLPALTALLHVHWVRHLGFLRPVRARVISWQPMLHRLGATLWILQGVVFGCISSLSGKEIDIKVTPKGPGGERRIGLKNIAPFLGLSASASIVLLLSGPSGIWPMTIAYSLIYILGAWLVTLLHWKENGFSIGIGSASVLAALAATSALLAIAVFKREEWGLPH